jgi:hypothetical protein
MADAAWVGLTISYLPIQAGQLTDRQIQRGTERRDHTQQAAAGPIRRVLCRRRGRS